MFEISLSVGDVNLDEVSLKCINCNKKTGLKTRSGLKEFYDIMITPFVMNSMLHNVGMSWMIRSKEEIDYDNFTNSKNLGWFDTGPWHNKNICSKLYGTTFEGFIIQDRTDRYNIMCSLVAHDRMENNKQYDESSIGDIEIPKDATVKALNSLGATFNFIDIWLHNCRHNYFSRSESYTVAMVEMLKKIAQNVGKPLTTREKKSKFDYRYWGWMVFGKM